jgi:predicted SprT family Zn-dependent metalloprotease
MNNSSASFDIRKLIQEACDKLNLSSLAPLIQIEWSNKMTKSAGMALGKTCPFLGKTYTIKFSKKLWGSMTSNVQKDLVLHETAHIITYYMYNKSVIDAEKQGGHGPTWQKIARLIGAKPVRYMESYEADFALYQRKVKRYNISCSCGKKITLTQHMLTKMKNGSRRVCKNCRTLVNPWQAIGV